MNVSACQVSDDKFFKLSLFIPLLLLWMIMFHTLLITYIRKVKKFQFHLYVPLSVFPGKYHSCGNLWCALTSLAGETHGCLPGMCHERAASRGISHSSYHVTLYGRACINEKNEQIWFHATDSLQFMQVILKRRMQWFVNQTSLGVLKFGWCWNLVIHTSD